VLDRVNADGIIVSMSPEMLLQENETLRKQVAERHAEIAERDAWLAERHAEIAERDAWLAERDARIAILEEELATLASKLRLTARERDTLAKKLKELQALRRARPSIALGQGVLAFLDAPAEEPQPEHVAEAPDGETPDDGIRGKHKPKKPARKLDITNLPVEHVHHELVEAERICAVTGKQLVRVGEKLEDEIVYQPAELKRRVHHRAVYGLSEADARERSAPELVAPGPPMPLEGSPVGASLLAWILVQKYLHHLPLYRQEQIFGRQGLRIPRQSMCDWVLASGEQLAPLRLVLVQAMIATGVVQIDDTPIKCQRGKGQGVFRARLWTLTSPLLDGVSYDFTEYRSAECIGAVVPGFEEGVLVGDGYSGYSALARERPGIATAGCWAHALRKFRDAMTEAPREAVRAVSTIGELFAVERQADEERLTHDERRALRERKAEPVLRRLEEQLAGCRDRYPESGGMGEACKYVENQRESLWLFLGDGRVPIHNNACEVAIRPVAIGRKNWLFAGSVRGGQAAATIYTLIECCKLAGVDPHAYLADVLVRVATHPASRVEELLPASWRRLFGPDAAAQPA
jgi:transposase